MFSSVSPSSRVALSRAACTRAALKPLVVAVAIALPSLSFAQTTTAGSDQTVIVTAARSAQAPFDVLSDNIVVTADEIAQSGQTNLLDLLQQKRGIEIATNGGPGTASSVYMRGANTPQSIVLIDGVRIGSSTAGGATWENIPLSQIDHIEIVYGPLSALYGADAMGGVIQIFTKQGDGALHASASVGVGSYGTHAVDVDIAGSSGDNKFHYAIDASRDESSGFPATAPFSYFYNPAKDGYGKDGASVRLSMDVAQGHVVGVDLLQSSNNAQYDIGLGYVPSTIEHLDTYAVYSRDQFVPGWTSLVRLSQEKDKNWSSNGPDWAANYNNAPTNIFNTTQNDFSWQNDFAIGADVLQVIAERREEKVDTNAGFGGDRNTNSIAASYQWKSGNQLAIASIRDDDSTQYGSQTTGGLAYGYKLSSALRVNASVGTSFRAPTFNELYYPDYGNPAIKPERGRNAETGVYYDDGKSQLNAVYYRNRITDLIVDAPTCPINSTSYPYGCAYNVDSVTLSGVTVGARTKIGNFGLHGSLDFQDPRDETTGTILARRSRQHGSVGVDYSEGKIQAGVDSVFSGKRYDNEANTQVLGGYGLLNLHANYALNKDWTLFGRWNNVLNKNYELAYGFNTPGANLFVGMRYGFN
jgi:vitamin B12 transporter